LERGDRGILRACETDRLSPTLHQGIKPGQQGDQSMSLSSARNYALRASKSQDQKEAIELLSKAIQELAMSIETTDAKIKKINKSS
jgi:L-ribulose-5-phosphate 3-epimerase UlaE